MPNSNNTPPVMRGGAEVKFEPLQNKAAIAFFKRKVPGLTQAWDDWIAPMHSHSFTIAGGMSIDFLTDMQSAISKALETGTGYQEFLADFDRIVAKYGWSYKGSRGWRSRVIFNTNMRTAHMAARWDMFQKNQDIAPYLEYQARNDNRTRPEHRAWDGTILPIDDAFWSSHYPPNGWNCRCDVVAHSAMSLKRKGKAVTPAPEIKRSDRIVNGKTYYNVPEGLDVGWDNNVGQAWLAPEVTLGKKLASLPPQIAGAAYQKQLSPSFLKAIDNSFAKYYDETQAAIKAQAATRKAPNFAPQFVGYLNHKVQAALAEKSIEVSNLSLITPHYQLRHLTGQGRGKEKKPAFVGDLYRELPSLLHDYRVVLLDTDGSLIYVPKKMAESGRVIKIIVKPNYSDKRSGFIEINQVTTMSLVPEWNLTELNLPVLDGAW